MFFLLASIALFRNQIENNATLPENVMKRAKAKSILTNEMRLTLEHRIIPSQSNIFFSLYLKSAKEKISPQFETIEWREMKMTV